MTPRKIHLPIPGPDAGPIVVFGGYAAISAGVLALASAGSGIAMVAVGLILAGVAAVVVSWSGAPLTDPSRPTESTTTDENDAPQDPS